METEEDIQIRHRKEQKELQAKIQIMKKSINKTDKKRRKEVMDQISILEVELDKRHTDELSPFSLTKKENAKSSNENNDQNGEVNEVIAMAEQVYLEQKKFDNVRVSKAQRRREKKAQQEKEKEERLMEGDMMNKNGIRQLEKVKIDDILKSRGLMVFDIPSDGDCLYRSIAHQVQFVNADISDKKSSVQDLRRLTADYLLQNANDFMPFLTNPDTGDAMTEDQYDDYCRQIIETSAWGGHIELKALSNVLKTPIEVIQAEGPSIVIGDEYGSGDKRRLTLTYHRHAFGLGEHYNSVQELSQVEDDFCSKVTANRR